MPALALQLQLMRMALLLTALPAHAISKPQDWYRRGGRSEGSSLTCSAVIKTTPAQELVMVMLPVESLGLGGLVQQMVGAHGEPRVRALNLEPGGLLSAELPVVVTRAIGLGPRKRMKHEVKPSSSAGSGPGPGPAAARAVGGFGVGASSGGQGAGHGSWAATPDII